MPATSYRIWGWGNRVGEGVMGAVHVGIAGVAKAADPNHPCAIANEIVCGDLARALRLPVPPGFVIKREADGVQHHVSLNFSLAGENLPPADASLVTTHQPHLSCGAILFDLWVANHDRHENNLAFDEDSLSLHLFDHGHAFMNGTKGREYLQTFDDGQVIALNCLTPELRIVEHFEEWQHRINSLPEYLIKDVVSDARNVGLPEDDVQFCTDFLLQRRSKLMNLVYDNRALFTSVDATKWKAA